jgi:acetyl-CoA carboxylase carboxyl transferase subunit alpha
MAANPKSGGRNAAPGLEFERPILELEQKIEELQNLSATTGMDLNGEIQPLKERCARLLRETFANLEPWQQVAVARHPNRPLIGDYVQMLFEDFFEVHGDRAFADDQAMLTGFARLEGERVLVVGHRKGKTTREKIACNFGCAHPEGYRKALGKMKIAAKFGLPILALIDTPGAYPGVGAEERGQAHAIALNILEMSRLPTPIVCVVTGEGGSGGALGIGVGDIVAVLEHAYYSVISPEGCAAILWKSGDMAARAASALRLTARDLLRFGIIDEVIPEPLGGAHRDNARMGEILKGKLLEYLGRLKSVPIQELLERRYRKFRGM